MRWQFLFEGESEGIRRLGGESSEAREDAMDIKSLWQVGSEMALFMSRDCATLRMLRTITEMLLLRYVRCVKPLENWLLISQCQSLERESGF